MPLFNPPLNPRVIAQSGVAVTHTGNTNEVAMATIPLPPMAAGDAVRVTALWSHTNSANNKTMRTRLGGLAGTAFRALVTTTTAVFTDEYTIRNRGTAATQVAQPGSSGVAFGTTAIAVSTGSVDTSTSKDLVLSAQLALGSESITLEGYTVELLKAA